MVEKWFKYIPGRFLCIPQVLLTMVLRGSAGGGGGGLGGLWCWWCRCWWWRSWGLAVVIAVVTLPLQRNTSVVGVPLNFLFVAQPSSLLSSSRPSPDHRLYIALSTCLCLSLEDPILGVGPYSVLVKHGKEKVSSEEARHH